MMKGQLKKYVGGSWITVELKDVKKNDRFKIIDFKNNLIQTFVAEKEATEIQNGIAVPIGNGLTISEINLKKEKKDNVDKGK